MRDHTMLYKGPVPRERNIVAKKQKYKLKNLILKSDL